MAARKQNKEELMFQIDQLRQESISHSVQSLALTFLSFLFYVTAPAILQNVFSPLGDPNVQRQIVMAVFTVPALFWVYTFVGSAMRMRRVKSIESEL